MKTLSYTLCAVLAAGFAFTGDAQVKPKSKKVTELKFSGRIQGQWDGIESDPSTDSEDRNHFYFRRLFLGGHAKAGDNWGGDIVMDFAASPNTEGSGKGDQVFIDGASVWYKHSDAFRVDLGQKKVPFGVEETTSSSKLKAIERSAVNRQFAETLKFNARHTGLFVKGKFDGGYSYDLAAVNSGQNHNSKDSKLKDGLYNYEHNALSYFGRIQWADYETDIRKIFGVAAGVMATDPSTVADDLTAYNIFGSIGTGPFNLDVEYMTGNMGNQDHVGYSAQASYAISNAPAGSWELVYRYSTVEGKGADDLVSAKEIVRRANFDKNADWEEVNELDQHYFGVNYLFNGHDAKLMVGYEMNELNEATQGQADMDGFRARVQFLF
jgi:phosphate-selective porin OprO/OprP